MEIIKDDAFRKLIKKGLSGGFLFFGEEDYLKLHALTSARKAVCEEESFAFFNDIRLDPTDFTPDVLVDALSPLPMMADKKIVSVSSLNMKAMSASQIDELCEALEALKEYDYNVLIISVPSDSFDEGRLPKNPSKLLTKLSKHLTPVRFEAVTQARLTAWAQKHFEHNGVSCPDELCHSLFERCGTSMFTLSNEIDKLSFYLLQNGRSTVCADDVTKVSCATVECDAFALSNAILDGNSEQALEALSAMKYNRTDPIIIFSEISKVFGQLVLIKSMLGEGKTPFEIAKIARLNEYIVKLYSSRLANIPEKKLKKALTLCSEADSLLKLSSQGYSVIENLLCTI